MKESIGFLAIGQGGGNIGLLFQEAGHTVLAVNSSKEDLDALEKMKHTFHLKGGEGCSKNRGRAQDLAYSNFSDLLNRIEQLFTDEEFIYVIFTTGGGTGSGASPMIIELLIRETEKKVGAVCVLPARDEPLKTQINAYECFKELENIDGMGPTFVLDNKKIDKFTINKQFVELFGKFIEIPQSQLLSFKGNIDMAEIKEMLSARGVAIISVTPQEKSSTAQLIKSFKENIFAPLEDDGRITYIGLSSAADIDIGAVKREVGQSLDTFAGKNTEHTVCILCGLSYPYAELKAMREKVEEKKSEITKTLSGTGEPKLSDGINFLEDIQKSRAKPAKKSDFSDVFAKYRKK